MSTLRKSIDSDLLYYTKIVSKLFRAKDRLGEATMPVDLLKREGFFSPGYGSVPPTIHIHTEDFSKDGRELLPIVGKWNKEFTEGGDFRLKGNIFGEVNIVLYGDIPDGCKLTVEEKEVEVPAVPAHVEIRRKYTLSDCEPLMQGDGDPRPTEEYISPGAAALHAAFHGIDGPLPKIPVQNVPPDEAPMEDRTIRGEQNLAHETSSNA